MIRNCYRLLLIIAIVPSFVFSQEHILKADTGLFNNSANRTYSEDEVKSYVLKLADDKSDIVIGGSITSIFHEQIDSVWIVFRVEKILTDSILSENGLFYLPSGIQKKNKLIDIVFKHPDYHVFDTSLIANSREPYIIFIELAPRYKISLRGRVYAGNLPVDGVKVQIREKEKLYNLETRGCYYDNENYWNCLYNGMFKQDLILDEATDSIYLSFEKDGMKPYSMGMILADYTGDIINIKMKFASKLSRHPKNCISLKLDFPFLSINNNWFVDLAYYRTLSSKGLDRFSIGLNANILLSPNTETYNTFQDNTASYDTSYFSGYVGPSVLFWLRKPDNRYFSTYAGITAGVDINKGDFFYQPFIGTRIFVDFNKAIGIELRHVPYDLDIVHYEFNPYGNAHRTTGNEKFKDFLLNIGLHIVF